MAHATRAAKRAAWDIPPAQYEADDDEFQISPGRRLVEELLELYSSGKMSAKRTCILMHWSYLAGVQEAKPYALHPDASSTGHYQRKLASALGFGTVEKKLYTVDVPLVVDGEREKAPVLMRLPHESLVEQFREEPELLADWKRRIHGDPWVEAFEQHPQIRGAGPDQRAKTLPLAIYMDAVEFQARDSLLVFTIRFLPSMKRHLAFAIRKSSFCNCGCSGWCTLFPLYRVIEWSLAALLLGRYPGRRHDGSSWRPTDSERIAMAGADLGFKAFVLDVQGDWAEFAHRWGFPAWNSHKPCFLCEATLDDIRQGSELQKPRNTEAYLQSCRECEVWVMVPSAELHGRIRFGLQNDSNRKGRCLYVNIPELGLQSGDGTRTADHTAKMPTENIYPK